MDMVDIKYYTKLFFNEKTGKERYSLIPKKKKNCLMKIYWKTVGK